MEKGPGSTQILDPQPILRNGGTWGSYTWPHKWVTWGYLVGAHRVASESIYIVRKLSCHLIGDEPASWLRGSSQTISESAFENKYDLGST